MELAASAPPPGDPTVGENKEKAGVSSSMDPAATTMFTSLASLVVVGEAASVVSMARSVEHDYGRSEREKNDEGGGPPPLI